MKLPEYLNKESTHKTTGVNTMSLLGLSLLWGHMLQLISLWFLPLTIFSILSGFGNEIENRNKKDAD